MSNNRDHLSTEESAHVRDADRFVVMFAIGFGAEDADDVYVAAEAALQRTRSGAPPGAQWLVLDRRSGDMTIIEPDGFDDSVALDGD